MNYFPNDSYANEFDLKEHAVSILGLFTLNDNAQINGFPAVIRFELDLIHRRPVTMNE